MIVGPNIIVVKCSESILVWHQQKCEYKGCTVLRYRATADAEMYIQSHGSLDLVTAAPP